MELLAFPRRSEEGTDTLLSSLNTRVHFWIRELQRMVVSLPADPNPMDTAPHGNTNRDEVPDGYNAKVQNQEVEPPPQAWRMAPGTGVHEGSGRWRTWACAYCGPATGLRIFGMASTSMTSFPTSIPFASTVHQDPKLLAGVSTKTEAGFGVAVPGSDTLQSSCFLGLAT